MKYLLLFNLIFITVFSVFADYDLEELQAFTNLIIRANSSVVPLDAYHRCLQELKVLDGSKENVDRQNLTNLKAATNCYNESLVLDKIPPSKALPLLFSLLENEKLTDFSCNLKDNKFNGSFGEWVYQLIIRKLQIFTKKDANDIVMIWLPEDSVMWNNHDLVFFWYYVGLKYLPTLWSDWYKCWKIENQRSEPRPKVLKKMANDLNRQFHYHLFPFVAKAIEDGDTSLKPLLEELSRCSYHRPLLYRSLKSSGTSAFNKPYDDPDFKDEKSFLVWWDKYKDNYIVAPSNKKLSDIKNIFERKYPPRFFTKEMYESALKAEKALDEYCKRENRPLTNCWYFNIKEGDLAK